LIELKRSLAGRDGKRIADPVEDPPRRGRRLAEREAAVGVGEDDVGETSRRYPQLP
jgi:hypothetical protein